MKLLRDFNIFVSECSQVGNNQFSALYTTYQPFLSAIYFDTAVTHTVTVSAQGLEQQFRLHPDV